MSKRAEIDAPVTEFALRIDCAANGCVEPHGDDGLLLRRGILDEEPLTQRVNGHVVTVVKRTVTYSAWTPVIPPEVGQP